MNHLLQASIAIAVLAFAGCSKKDKEPAAAAGSAASAAAGSAAAAPTAKSGLAWEPDNYGTMSETCRKVLGCCVELAKQAGTTTAEDFNLKCSGPAMWKDDECETDLKARVAMLEGKPVPDACK